MKPAHGGMNIREGKPKAPPKELSHLEIHHGENGGHMIKHVHTSYEHEPEMHMFGADEGEKAMSHIAEHMGMKHEAEEEDEDEE